LSAQALGDLGSLVGLGKPHATANFLQGDQIQADQAFRNTTGVAQSVPAFATVDIEGTYPDRFACP